MPPIIDVSRETLEGRREEILRRLGIDYEEFERREALGVLSDAEWSVVDDLAAIAFLLDEPTTAE